MNELDNSVLRIYPNPVNEIITIESSFSVINSEYVIYDTQGRIIQKGFFNNTQIDVTLLNNGAYVLQIDNEYHIQFVKQK
jgi:hypothetical protein